MEIESKGKNLTKYFKTVANCLNLGERTMRKSVDQFFSIITVLILELTVLALGLVVLVLTILALRVWDSRYWH